MLELNNVGYSETVYIYTPVRPPPIVDDEASTELRALIEPSNDKYCDTVSCLITIESAKSMDCIEPSRIVCQKEITTQHNRALFEEGGVVL